MDTQDNNKDSSEGVLIVNERGGLISYNEKLLALFGVASRDMQKNHQHPLPFLQEQYPKLNFSVLTKSKSENQTFYFSLGENQPLEVKKTVLFSQERKDVDILYSFHLIEPESEEHLAYLAYHDPLTDLPNRRLLVDRLHMAFAQAKRRGTSLTIMFLDLDGFKLINDTLGHASGDSVLIEVAARLQKSVREEDTVARLGGDEFVLVFPQIDHIENVEKVASRLVQILSHPVQLGEGEVKISTSLGIALYPQDGHDLDSLLANADRALYLAKSKGRNNFQFFNETKAPSPLILQEIPEHLERRIL